MPVASDEDKAAMISRTGFPSCSPDLSAIHRDSRLTGRRPTGGACRQGAEPTAAEVRRWPRVRVPAASPLVRQAGRHRDEPARRPAGPLGGAGSAAAAGTSPGPGGSSAPSESATRARASWSPARSAAAPGPWLPLSCAISAVLRHPAVLRYLRRPAPSRCPALSPPSCAISLSCPVVTARRRRAPRRRQCCPGSARWPGRTGRRRRR
jgi:hypothetical protein